MFHLPALGSIFFDSYNKSSACNGCTWIFDGLTNWSIGVANKSTVGNCPISFLVAKFAGANNIPLLLSNDDDDDDGSENVVGTLSLLNSSFGISFDENGVENGRWSENK